MLEHNKLVVLGCRLSISGSAESPQLPQYKTKGNRDKTKGCTREKMGYTS